MVDIQNEMPRNPKQVQAEQDAAVKSSLDKIKNKIKEEHKSTLEGSLSVLISDTKHAEPMVNSDKFVQVFFTFAQHLH